MTESRHYAALRRVGQEWTGERTERLLAATHRRIRRSRQRRVAALAAVCLVGICFVLFTRSLGWRKPDVSRRAITPVAFAPRPTVPSAITLSDGSCTQLLDAQSHVEIVSESSTEQILELRQGGARFDVVPRRARQFVVRAGAVAVHVVGTEFLVELRGAHTWVQVTRGRVQVTWENGEQLLGPGEQNLFPGYQTTEDAAVPVRASAAGKSAADAFRSRARQREYAEAFAVMQATPGVVGRSVDDLMLAADVARLSGHPAQALPFLESVLREHESDPRAALAAFTLGRTLFGLGRNQAASRAFARVAALAPASALAEDALARQVEAAARAGDRAAAQKLAQQYLKAYPTGRRAAAVREQAGLQ